MCVYKHHNIYSIASSNPHISNVLSLYKTSRLLTKQPNKQPNKQANKQTNKQTKKHTNKHPFTAFHSLSNSSFQLLEASLHLFLCLELHQDQPRRKKHVSWERCLVPLGFIQYMGVEPKIGVGKLDGVYNGKPPILKNGWFGIKKKQKPIFGNTHMEKTTTSTNKKWFFGEVPHHMNKNQ